MEDTGGLYGFDDLNESFEVEDSGGSGNYVPLKEMKIYQLARRLSEIAWNIYSRMSFEEKKILGDQFIRATDSIGANITEGYGRYHYLDKVRFFYNARASQSEATDHWLELLLERNKIDQANFNEFKSISKELQIKLNNYIKITRDENNK